MKTSDLVRKLPDVYRKDPKSNNYKLLQLSAEALEELREAAALTEESQDIRTAIGQTLDLHGEKGGQPRGSADDARYRVLLYHKMARDRGDGTQPDISVALQNIMECGPGEFTIRDREDRDRRVRMRVAGTQVLEQSPASKAEIKAILDQLLPAGVSFSFQIPYLSEFLLEQSLAPVLLTIRAGVDFWALKPVPLDGSRLLDGSWKPGFWRFGLFLPHAFRLRWACRLPVRSGASVTMHSPVWRLDGTYLLDGTKRLRAGQTKKEDF